MRVREKLLKKECKCGREYTTNSNKELCSWCRDAARKAKQRSPFIDVTCGGGPHIERICLRCDNVFDSLGRGNRICPKCSGVRVREEDKHKVKIGGNK